MQRNSLVEGVRCRGRANVASCMLVLGITVQVPAKAIALSLRENLEADWPSMPRRSAFYFTITTGQSRKVPAQCSERSRSRLQHLKNGPE